MRLDAIWRILKHNFEIMLQWYFILLFSCDHVLMLHLAPIFANVNNIFFAGGEAGHFEGGSFYPSNTLDRTLHLGGRVLADL